MLASGAPGAELSLEKACFRTIRKIYNPIPILGVDLKYFNKIVDEEALSNRVSKPIASQNSTHTLFYKMFGAFFHADSLV